MDLLCLHKTDDLFLLGHYDIRRPLFFIPDGNIIFLTHHLESLFEPTLLTRLLDFKKSLSTKRI